MIFLWIITALLIFTIVVLIHELGHFSTARFFWVKVEEFWLWIPPRIKTIFKDKKWTNYTINWLPLWGFVRLKWENLANLKEKKDKDALINKPYYQQAIIILAWVIMNFLLASLIFSFLFYIWVKPIWINNQIKTNLNVKLIPTYKEALQNKILIKSPWILVEPIKNSIAQKSWLKSWDIILEVNNKKLNSPKELINIFSKNKNKTVFLKVKRKNKIIILKIKLDKNWKMWAYIWDNIKINKNFEYKYDLINSIKYWFLETYNQSLLTIEWLKILAKKIFAPKNNKERQEAIKSMSWPIWIVDFIANSISNWIIFLLIITAIISINLWVFNLLPIPALDWWRFIFILINSILIAIFWKKIIWENIENFIHLIFFLLLIALSILIWYNDITKIISK